MNARSQVFEIGLEARQVEEAVLCMFHTVLFHRSYGKFAYKDDNSFTVGTLGFDDVDCEHIDCTYVRPSSPALDQLLREEVSQFSTDLKGVRSGQVDPNSCQCMLQITT